MATRGNAKSNSNTSTPTITKPIKNMMKQEIKAAVAKQTVRKLTAKAEQTAAQRAVTKVEKKMMASEPQKVEKRSFLQKLAGAAGKAWNWLQEGGWETLLTVGSILALTGEENQNKYTRHLVGNQTIESGTVIAKIPISADMFDDVNDRLQRQLSLYTYYAFTNSSIHFKGAQGDLVNGQIGMFIVPDPDLIIASNDSAAIVRLIREYGGRIMKLNQAGSIKIPEVNRLLAVQPGMTDERRTFVQGTLYIVAVTDLSYDGPLGEFAIQYNIEMTKAANTGLVSLPDPSCKVMSYVNYSFPGGNNPPTQFDYEDQYEKSYPDFIQTQYLKGASFDFSSQSGVYELYPPGIYRVSSTALANFTTNGAAQNNLQYFQGFQMVVCASQTPTWNSSNDPTNTNYWVVGTQVYSMIRTASELSTMTINPPDIVLVETEPFYIGYNCGMQNNGGDVSGSDTLQFDVYFVVEQIQQFPIPGFSFELETQARDVKVAPVKRILELRDKKEKPKQPVAKEAAGLLLAGRRTSTSPTKI